jgi:hypothetical protein
MRDSAEQTELIKKGERSVQGNAEWVWGYDPVADWNKAPTVPATEAAL